MIDILTSFADTYSNAFLVLHLFAMVLGLGGATYSDILLAKFLKDYRISYKEAEVIHTMARVIFIGIFLAFISGIMLFLPSAERLMETPKFLAKSLIFGVVVLNGFLLHHIILPKMIHFSFHKEVYLSKKFHLRQAGFVAGAISVVSWYSIFLLAGFKNNPFSFAQIMWAYVGILIGAIITALFVEYRLKQRVKGKRKK